MRLLLGLLCACSSPKASEPAAQPVLVVDAAVVDPVAIPDGPSLSAITYGPVTFRATDRVRVVQRAGTVKPADSKHGKELVLGPGRTGVVLGGEHYVNYRGYGMDVDVVVIRWDAQRWHEYVGIDSVLEQGKPYTADELDALHVKAETLGPPVELPSFVSTVSPSYLEVVR